MHDQTGFQRNILFVIAGLEEPHGITVTDELDDYFEQEINHGRLYPNLDTLVEEALVKKGKKDRPVIHSCHNIRTPPQIIEIG